MNPAPSEDKVGLSRFPQNDELMGLESLALLNMSISFTCGLDFVAAFGVVAEMDVIIL